MGLSMILFDGRFAQDYVYPLALAAYNSISAPGGFTRDVDAFEIIANISNAEYLARSPYE
jgi:hypothetical protein